jgi:hypothetical protein
VANPVKLKWKDWWMRPGVVWAVAAAGTIAWLGLFSAVDRYAAPSRYAGNGVIVLVFFGVVPLAALSLAMVHQLWHRARPIPGVLAVAAGALPILVLGVSVIDGEARLAERRHEEARARDARARFDAELGRLGLRELVDAASEVADAQIRGDMAARLAFGRLGRETLECEATPDVASYVMKKLATRGYPVAHLAHLAQEACPLLREPLREALVEGLIERRGAADDAFLVVELIETDGAMLTRVHERVRFSPRAVRAAIEDLMTYRRPEKYTRARRIIELGLQPFIGERRLSAVLREDCAERNEAWPEGGRPEELALHRALIAAEQR